MLECLQKSIKIAGSCIEEVLSVHLYCIALDQVRNFAQPVISCAAADVDLV